MASKNIRLFGLVIAMLIAMTPFAVAKQTIPAPFMAKIGLTTQPAGHHEFCKHHRNECLIKTRGDARVHLTADRWNQLVAVNAGVNRDIKPVTDKELFGREEVWFYPTTMGDCEDFVLLKRRELIASGWPVGALLLTVVRQLNGDGHAVLTVLTDRGDLILDNLESEIKLWSDTDYRYIKRQSQFDTGRWVAIDDARTSPTVGSLSR